MKIDKEIVDYLTNHKDAINDHDYRRLYLYVELEKTPQITYVLKKAYIDPLQYMQSVPAQYAKGITVINNIRIPEGVIIIGACAFQNCIGLTNVTICSGVAIIGERSFFNCTNLKNITYQGTKVMWNDIEKGYQWDENTGDYTIHCTDGDILKDGNR